MSKRIILVGPACAGKDYIKRKFVEKGYVPDISYTSRAKRGDEVDGVDYHFISEEQFLSYVEDKQFYEYVKHGDYYYGTGLYYWNTANIFIMEANGIDSIQQEDRKRCLIIFVTAPGNIRIKRMRERGWDNNKITERFRLDTKKFEGFTNYDLIINSVGEM
jgi:guanylate kinase